MHYYVIDFEFNRIDKGAETREARKITTQEIIEIGCVRLDENYCYLEEDGRNRFQTFVSPQYSKFINESVAILTGISDDDLRRAPDFKTAMKSFNDWIDRDDEYEIFAWSETDYSQFVSECALKNLTGEFPALEKQPWTDMQRLFCDEINMEREISLTDALGAIEAHFVGSQHRASDDAFNEGVVLQCMKNKDEYDKRIAKIRAYLEPQANQGSTLGDVWGDKLKAFLSDDDDEDDEE